jgi:hypothetical protein
MSIRFLRYLAVAAACVVVFPTGARAEPIALLDQTATGISQQAFVCCGFQWAQTFTGGLKGRLTGVEVYLGDAAGGFSGEGPLRFDVRRVDGDEPSDDSADVLASGALETAAFTSEGFYALNLATAWIAVRPGDRFAIVLSNAGPDFPAPWTWRFSDRGESPYPQGQMFFRLNPAAAWSVRGFAGQDFAFRTFVSPAAVPEPASLVLAASGLLLMLAVAKGRFHRPMPTRVSNGR